MTVETGRAPVSPVDLSELELSEGWYEDDEAVRWRDGFPSAPGASDLTAESLAVVYFELDPGKRLGSHTDSEEEVLFVVEGDVLATVGDETAELSAGEMTIVPADTPHVVENTGNGTARLLGFFPDDEVHHEFEEPVMPYGTRVSDTGVDPDSAG
jgi:quercetin dioxygenase-like cupin family protein